MPSLALAVVVVAVAASAGHRRCPAAAAAVPARRSLPAAGRRARSSTRSGRRRRRTARATGASSTPPRPGTPVRAAADGAGRRSPGRWPVGCYVTVAPRRRPAHDATRSWPRSGSRRADGRGGDAVGVAARCCTSARAGATLHRSGVAVGGRRTGRRTSSRSTATGGRRPIAGRRVAPSAVAGDAGRLGRSAGAASRRGRRALGRRSDAGSVVDRRGVATLAAGRHPPIAITTPAHPRSPLDGRVGPGLRRTDGKETAMASPSSP